MSIPLALFCRICAAQTPQFPSGRLRRAPFAPDRVPLGRFPRKRKMLQGFCQTGVEHTPRCHAGPAAFFPEAEQAFPADRVPDQGRNLSDMGMRMARFKNARPLYSWRGMSISRFPDAPKPLTRRLRQSVHVTAAAKQAAWPHADLSLSQKGCEEIPMTCPSGRFFVYPVLKPSLRPQTTPIHETPA